MGPRAPEKVIVEREICSEGGRFSTLPAPQTNSQEKQPRRKYGAIGARNQSLKSDNGKKGNPKSKTVHDVPSPLREIEKDDGRTEEGPK